MACVARSRQDSKRVHVHLMAHERTMATVPLSLTGTGSALGRAQTRVDGWVAGIDGWKAHGGKLRQHSSYNIVIT